MLSVIVPAKLLLFFHICKCFFPAPCARKGKPLRMRCNSKFFSKSSNNAFTKQSRLF